MPKTAQAEMTPDTVYITYIATSVEKVWDAFTRDEFTKQYFFDTRVESDWREGGPWALHKPDGGRAVFGKVLIADRPRQLQLSWNVEGMNLPECIVTYDIEPDGDAVKLTMTEHHPAPLDPKWLEGGKQGWPKILSGLKTLLETGAPLRTAPPKPSSLSARTFRTICRTSPWLGFAQRPSPRSWPFRLHQRRQIPS